MTATKSKKTKEAASTRPDPSALQITQREGESHADAVGRMLVDPSVNAVSTMQSFQSFLGSDIGMMSTVAEVKRITDAVNRGDVSDLEGMLVGQAIALQTIFTSLARRAQSQEYQVKLEAFLGLAFKAQAQSRAAIQAVAELKHPRQVAFVKQANITTGNQQVNNGTAPPAEIARPVENKLLEAADGKWLDAGATLSAKRDDQELAALGQVHGTAQRVREGEGGA